MTGQREKHGEGHDHRSVRDDDGQPGATGGDDPQPPVPFENGNGGKNNESGCAEGTVDAHLSRWIGRGNDDHPVGPSWNRRRSPVAPTLARPIEDTCGTERVAVTHGFPPISIYMTNLLEITTAAGSVNSSNSWSRFGSSTGKARMESKWGQPMSLLRHGTQATSITRTAEPDERRREAASSSIASEQRRGGA